MGVAVGSTASFSLSVWLVSFWLALAFTVRTSWMASLLAPSSIAPGVMGRAVVPGNEYRPLALVVVSYRWFCESSSITVAPGTGSPVV